MDEPKSVIRSMPKIELHAHLSGSLSEEGLKTLLYNSDFPQDKIEKLLMPLSSKTLSGCFEIFKIIHELTNKLEVVKQMTKLVLKEFTDDGVKYLELRTTPKCVPESYNKADYIQTVLDTIIEYTNEEVMMVRILLSIDRGRTISDAEDTLRLFKIFSTNPKYEKYLVGLDVSGDPCVGSLKDYTQIFKEAKRSNFKIAAHLMEVNSKTSFEEAYHLINLDLVDRIGHGTYIHPQVGGNAELYGLIRSKNIPFEICLTSNFLCGQVASIEAHPVKHYMADGHPFVICTDDKGVFRTTLSREMEQFCEVFGDGQNDLLEMANLATVYTFLPEKDKDMLRININKNAV